MGSHLAAPDNASRRPGPSRLAIGATSTTDLAGGAASAPEVPIAIGDQLRDGIDDMVGTSFLRPGE